MFICSTFLNLILVSSICPRGVFTWDKSRHTFVKSQPAYETDSRDSHTMIVFQHKATSQYCYPLPENLSPRCFSIPSISVDALFYWFTYGWKGQGGGSGKYFALLQDIIQGPNQLKNPESINLDFTNCQKSVSLFYQRLVLRQLSNQKYLSLHWSSLDM